MMLGNITSAFRGRTEFRWYLSALFCGFAGLQTHAFLIGWLAFAITGSNKAVATVILVTGLTNVLIAPLLGLLVDRASSLKRLMQFSFLGIAAIALGIGLQIEAGLELKHLLIATVFKAIVVSVFDSARQAMLLEVSDKSQATSATAMVRSSANLAQITLPPLAGWAIASMHASQLDITPAEYVYYATAGIFILAFILMGAVPTQSTNSPALNINSKASVLEGFRYVAHTPVVRSLLLVNWLLICFNVLFVALIPGYAIDVLGVGPGHYGTLFASCGIGALLGSLIAASLPGMRRGRLVLLAGAITASAFFLLSSETNYVVALVLAGAIGVGEGLRVSLTSALIQSYVNRAFLGRVFGIEALETALVQVAAFWVGHSADLQGSSTTMAVSSAVLFICVLGVYLFMPTFRRLE